LGWFWWRRFTTGREAGQGSHNCRSSLLGIRKEV